MRRGVSGLCFRVGHTGARIAQARQRNDILQRAGFVAGTRALRSEGTFEAISAMLRPSAKQTLRVADAVARGDVRRPDGTQVEGITRVFPCAVVYDRVPLRPPISERYERHLEKELGRPVFSASGSLMPLQFFDLETIEGWEEYMDMGPQSAVAFEYLAERGTTPWLRHGRQFPNSAAPRPRTQNGPHQRYIAAALEYFAALEAEAGIRA